MSQEIPVFGNDAVGKDIEAVCSKCGESWHVIVAVWDGKIEKVECKSCRGQHKYKPIARDRMTLKKNTKTSIAVGTKEGSPLPAAKKAKAPATPTAPKVLTPQVTPNDKPIQKYSIKQAHYACGDRIEHPKFGIGVVDGLPMANKMYVTFQTERVMLVYGK